MTAEQLEELLVRLFAEDAETMFDALEDLQAIAPSLARRVLAAEKLVEALETALAQDDDHLALCRAAISAYREASK